MLECGCPPRPPSPAPIREVDKRYSAGEVYGTWESVYTAIYDIFRTTHITNLGTSLYCDSLRSHKTLASQARAIPKPRPCVMMQWQNDDPKTGTRAVCLATTLRGSKLSAMPQVFQHFCIPIYPHGDITRRTPGHLHLHAEPEWEREGAWIIAWIFQSKSELSGRWMDARPETIAAAGEAQPWFFGETSMALLRSECRKRRFSWTKKCSNRLAAMTYYGQVKGFYKTHASAQSWVDFYFNFDGTRLKLTVYAQATLPPAAHGVDGRFGNGSPASISHYRTPSVQVRGYGGVVPPRADAGNTQSKTSLAGNLQNITLDDIDRGSMKSTAHSTRKHQERGKLVARLPSFNRFAALRQNSKSST